MGQRILESTGLIHKKGASKKIATDEVEGMIWKFKYMYQMAQEFGWGTDPEIYKGKDQSQET